MASDVIEQLALGVGSSVITGTAVWLAQRARTTGRLRGRRAFLGLTGRHAGACRLVVGLNPKVRDSVARLDVVAMLEVAAMVRALGSEPAVLSPAEAVDAPDAVEFCIGGPDANPRLAAHLRQLLPGLTFVPFRPDNQDAAAIVAGDQRFRRERGRTEYVVVARATRPGRPPVFLIAGQVPGTNRAGAAYLAANVAALRRRFGDDRPFCLVLRVVEAHAYGHRDVSEAADVTAEAVRRPPEPAPDSG